MYRHCLFCSRDLGRNEALEAFPAGRRLAYDAAQGRLWVVCSACGRWNLTPLEERWEAVEQAERLFRRTRMRSSTDNVGLARVADGLDLVRIGAPLRPEFAAWRYAPLLAVRRRRQIVATGTLLAATGAATAAGVVAGVIGVSALGRWGQSIFGTIVHGRQGAVVARIEVAPKRYAYVKRSWLPGIRLELHAHGDAVLVLPNDGQVARLRGPDFVRAAGLLLPAVNRYGGSAADVADATGFVDRSGGPAGVLRRLVEPEGRAGRIARRMIGVYAEEGNALADMPVALRLALEMSAHEEQERRAMDGDLADLERAWRDAEEVAAVADDLGLPDRVQHAFTRLRGRRTDGSAG